MEYFGRLVDKLVFTFGCIITMQLPAFIAHYRQRLGGHLDEARSLLASYERLAERNFGGDMQRLLQEYEQNQSPAIQETGRIIQENLDRIKLLEENIADISNQSMWLDIIYFLFGFDSQVAKGTLEGFAPTVPLQLDAWILGLMGGLLASGALIGCYRGGIKAKEAIDDYRQRRAMSRF